MGVIKKSSICENSMLNFAKIFAVCALIAVAGSGQAAAEQRGQNLANKMIYSSSPVESGIGQPDGSLKGFKARNVHGNDQQQQEFTGVFFRAPVMNGGDKQESNKRKQQPAQP